MTISDPKNAWDYPLGQSDDYKRERFAYSLKAISDMIRGVLEIVKKWYSDEGVEH